MKQDIDMALWQEFEKEQKKERKKLEKIATSNSGEPINFICKNVRISELAGERGINTCLEGHKLYFDDSAGLFCCSYVKFGVSKCFSGNLIQFTKFLMDEGKWN